MKPEQRSDVVIVGGGPVGLLLANLLGQAGHQVILFEGLAETTHRSMAIGITPPSLEILARLDLDQTFIRSGVKIEDVVVHEAGAPVGRLRFHQAADTYPFILSLPQATTVDLLYENTKKWPTVHVMTGWRVTGLSPGEKGVKVVAVDANDNFRQLDVFAAWVVGCDGARSYVAEAVGIGKTKHVYRPTFQMADYIDHSGLGRQAHLYFGPERPVESFPLPNGQRRWIIRSGWQDVTDLQEPMEAAIHRLTGIHVESVDRLDQSWFHPAKSLAHRFYRGRVMVCGDAAHTMSPIGGQGMNSGFGDAFVLSHVLHHIVRAGDDSAGLLRRYERMRKMSFRTAARRSAIGMRLGVAHGSGASRARGMFVKWLLRHGATHRFMVRWFTMRSLPDVLNQAAASLGFKCRFAGPELMDDPACDTPALVRTLEQFRIMNRLVSRYRTILSQWVLAEMQRDPARSYHLIDLGAGGCDIPVWLLKKAWQKKLNLKVTAIDGDVRAVQFARLRYENIQGLKIVHGHLLDMDCFGPVDFIFSNHVMHHLPDEVIPAVMEKMNRTASRHWVISDLHRSPWAYFGFHFIGCWFHNSFTFEDGKRSIRRGFTKNDMAHYVATTGLTGKVAIRYMVPGRILAVGGNSHATVIREGGSVVVASP